jgi:flagellar hook assembly protein FlgD
LSGRRLRDLSIERDQPSGEHHIPWDGRDDDGRVVPPGTYLVVVELSTDGQGRLRRVAPVAVVY